jgi:hypothetical protein
MAVLTSGQLVEGRQVASRTGPTVTHTKGVANAALQAVEDWFEVNRSGLNAAINAATSPVVLTAGQKTALVRAWLAHKARTE